MKINIDNSQKTVKGDLVTRKEKRALREREVGRKKGQCERKEYCQRIRSQEEEGGQGVNVKIKQNEVRMKSLPLCKLIHL